MTALEAARAVDAPDWLIGAGAVRDCVWAALHQVDPPPPRDVDLAFFDPADLAEEREREVHQALRELAPGIAPLGLDDLFSPAWRHNPRRATSAHFRERLRDKQIAQRWPLVRIVDS